jgi:transposase
VARPSKYSADFRARAVRLVAEARPDHETEWAAMTSGAAKLGVGAETVRKWVRRSEVDAGQRPGVTGEESAELKRLRRENAELRRANKILKAASAFSPPSSTAPGRDDPLRGRAQGTFRGRADHRCAARRRCRVPVRVRLLRRQDPPAVAAVAGRYGSGLTDPPGARVQLQRLRGAQRYTPRRAATASVWAGIGWPG